MEKAIAVLQELFDKLDGEMDQKTGADFEKWCYVMGGIRMSIRKLREEHRKWNGSSSQLPVSST